MPLSKEMLNELFEYRDGEIYYKVSRSRNKVGSKAGTYRKHDNAYQVIIKRKHYLIHRVVFMMHHGYLPQFVDHIDGNRANNKIENLREATHSQNAHNCAIRKDSKTNVKNVSWNKVDKSWKVRIQVNHTRITIGQFKDLELAELVAMEARNKFHGQFANHGYKENISCY
jgi:nucleoside diphosphate kinase